MDKAAEVMNDSAVHLNDKTLSIFTYEKQLPYLNIAFREVEELYQANNVPVTNNEESDFTIPIGVTDIGGESGIPLPNTFVEPIDLFEREDGSNNDYVKMTHMEFLPPRDTALEFFMYWAYLGGVIKFPPSTSVMQLKLRFVGKQFSTIDNENSFIKINGLRTFLGYRTAALCAEFMGENESRAQSLNTMAQLAVDRMLSISTKGRQNIATRRRPFLAGYKNRTIL